MICLARLMTRLRRLTIKRRKPLTLSVRRTFTSPMVATLRPFLCCKVPLRRILRTMPSECDCLKCVPRPKTHRAMPNKPACSSSTVLSPVRLTRQTAFIPRSMMTSEQRLMISLRPMAKAVHCFQVFLVPQERLQERAPPLRLALRRCFRATPMQMKAKVLPTLPRPNPLHLIRPLQITRMLTSPSMILSLI